MSMEVGAVNWSQSQLTVKQYVPCFIDVRQAVISSAVNQDSLLLRERVWNRVVGSHEILKEMTPITIKRCGWPQFQKGDYCTIRRDSGYPEGVRGVKCVLQKRVMVDSEPAEPMWEVETRCESVPRRSLNVLATHLNKIHGPPCDFESLNNSLWMGDDVLNSFLEIMARSMGWGHGEMPPTAKPATGKRKVWIANSLHMNLESDEQAINPSFRMNVGVSGQYLDKHFKARQGDSGNPDTHKTQKDQAKIRMRELALSVTDAIFTINPKKQHWTYAIVDFRICIITLDDPLGLPSSVDELKLETGVVRTLTRLHKWAVSMQTARSLGLKWQLLGSNKPLTGIEIQHPFLASTLSSTKVEFTHEELGILSGIVTDSFIKVGDLYYKPAILPPFEFRVRLTTTQRDSYQCGPHTTANILLLAGDIDDKRVSTVVAQDIRLWMAYILWLHSDSILPLPSADSAHNALHQKFKARKLSGTSRECLNACPQLFF